MKTKNIIDTVLTHIATYVKCYITYICNCDGFLDLIIKKRLQEALNMNDC